MGTLNLGLLQNGKTFSLPANAAVQTFAILAIRGAGKTCTATVMAEEMCKAGLPWICLDPVGVWWGLRASRDGKPGGYPVVVLGGQHADILIERDSGKRVAEALMSENVFGVVDLSRESKKFWHTFLTDFCLELMQMSPDVPRHLFIEEAPEFAPQRTRVELTARCKEAVERLVRLGRNQGYGCTLIGQRPATIDKDILSQCENLLVLRTVGAHDRKALGEWIEAKASERGLEKFLGDLAGLPNGTAWFWSPHWLDQFQKVRIRERETFHPGETRTVGKAIKAVALSDVRTFVQRLKVKLSKKQVSVSLGRRSIPSAEPFAKVVSSNGSESLQAQISSLRSQIAELRKAREDADRRLKAVRDMLQPQWRAMKGLFETLGDGRAAGLVDRSAYESWLAKAGKTGTKRLLEVMLERTELTRTQLATLAGLGPNTGTYRNYLSWLRRNGLVETDGETVRLRPL